MAVDTERLNLGTTALLAGLAALGERMDAVRETLERREQESPGIFQLGSVAKSSSLRLRVKELVLSVTAAGTFGLMIGTTDEGRRFNFAAAGTLVIPMPITIDSGKDISISGTAANILNAYVTFFADYKEGGQGYDTV
jgi:hypothetical protein